MSIANGGYGKVKVDFEPCHVNTPLWFRAKWVTTSRSYYTHKFFSKPRYPKVSICRMPTARHFLANPPRGPICTLRLSHINTWNMAEFFGLIVWTIMQFSYRTIETAIILTLHLFYDAPFTFCSLFAGQSCPSNNVFMINHHSFIFFNRRLPHGAI